MHYVHYGHYGALRSITGHYRALPRITEHYVQHYRGFTDLYLALRSITCSITGHLWGITGALQSITEHYRALQ